MGPMEPRGPGCPGGPGTPGKPGLPFGPGEPVTKEQLISASSCQEAQGTDSPEPASSGSRFSVRSALGLLTPLLRGPVGIEDLLWSTLTSASSSLFMSRQPLVHSSRNLASLLQISLFPLPLIQSATSS